MTAREILLKHVNEGTSERAKKLHEIVDWSVFIAAMEEYAEQQVKNLNKPAVIGSLPNIKCSLCNFETDNQIDLLRHHHTYHS